MKVEATICCITNKDKVLLKMANRGISKGNWNFPGGGVEPNETLGECVIREVFEETGLKIKNLKRQGTLHFSFEGKDLEYIVHLFSSRTFSGRIKSSEEGEVRWFDANNLPLNKMWDGDKYWIPLMMEGKHFVANFCYDRGGKRTLRYDVVFES